MKPIRGLLVMDVDGTLILEEVIDLLGEAAGLGGQVAEITGHAMMGELDFEAALEKRVGLLEGLPETIFDSIQKKIHLTKGARELINELHQRHYKVAVVSGGFHEIVDRLACELQLDHVKANRLEKRNGYLTGRVLGNIVTQNVKKEMLEFWAQKYNLDLSSTIAVGDGANDLFMIQRAGIGVAFNAKPIVRHGAAYQINEYDLYQILEIVDRNKQYQKN